MTTPDSPLPTYKDIFPNDIPCLDCEHAAKNFLGKNLADAEAMFRENFIYYTEDLWAMSTAAFEYYLPAVWNYITSEASRDDHTVQGFVNVVFQCRHQEDKLGRSVPLVLECMDYLMANLDKFDISETPESETSESDMHAVIARLHQDVNVRQLLETEWIKSGGTAEAFPELWKTLVNLPDDLKRDPERPILPLLERWNTLRAEIAGNESPA